jgi:SAM-dependent methyltransferase
MKTTSRHDMVKESYTDMLKGVRGDRSCCANNSDSNLASSPAAKLAGYEDVERHGEAAAASFGCGNPLAFAGVQQGDTVLDLGSGAGLDLLIAAEKTGPAGKVIGVDMTDDMIEAARSNASQAGYSNIEVRRGLIEELPVESDSVDWVISNCVINLSPEKSRVFSELSRVMKPGAHISISDIVVEDLPDWIRESAAAWSACVAGAISEQAYVDGLRGAGLEGVEVTERLVYDASQLRAILCEDIPGLDLDIAQIESLLEEYAGTVWSARFTGHKPR